MKSHLLAALVVTTLLAGCTAEARKARWLARAERNLEAGKYDEAKIDYIKVLQKDAGNATAFSRLGRIWLEQGVPIRAGPFLFRAKELDPTDTGNRLRLARVYQSDGQIAKAADEIRALVEEFPPSGEALVFLAEMARSPDEIRMAEQVIERFPDKETPSYELALANIAFRKRDLAATEKALHRAVAFGGRSPEAHQGLATFYLLRKNIKAGGEELKLASELAPPRSAVHLAYAEYVRQTEGAEAATAFLKELTRKAPDYLPAWILLGRIALAEKKHEEVRAFLENVFSRDPVNVEGRMLQADSFLAQGEPAKALGELERLDRAFPEQPGIKYRLALISLRDNKLPQAEALLDQALGKSPDYLDAILLRAQVNLQTGRGPAAIETLEGLVKNQPDAKPAQLLLADAYRAAGRLDDAANLFREQIKLNPTSGEPVFFLGMVLQEQKKIAEARQAYERALELAPDNLLPLSQLVELDLQAQDFTAAEARVRKQLEKHPEVAGSHILAGKVHVAQRQWKEAETALKKSIELDANLLVAYDLLVSVYLATDQLPAAVREVEAGLAQVPRNERGWMTLALLRGKQREYEKARDAYEKILAFKPDFVPALNNLAYLYAEQLNQLDKASELAQKARQLEPSNPAVADTLGWTLYKRGEYDQALPLLREGADKLANNPESKFHLGMAYYMMGQTAAARAALEQALSAAADFPGKAEAESRLALLRDSSQPASGGDIPQLEKMLDSQPGDLVAQLRLAEAYEQAAAWDKAARTYEAAVAGNPKLASAILKLAQIYAGPLTNKEKGIGYAKQARPLLLKDPKATAVLGRIGFDAGDFSWAYSLLQESSSQLPSDPEVLRDFAWAAYGLGKVQDARNAMQRCLGASPGAATAEDARSFLALTELDENSPDAAAARARIDLQLKEKPRYAPALAAAAALDLKDGKNAEAMQGYEKVLGDFPEFTPAQKQLAGLYAEIPEREAEAYNLATKARKALPDDAAVAQILGQLSFKRKEYSRALQLLEESGRKAPLSPLSLYYLGLCYKEARQPTKAIGALSAAVAGGLPDRVLPDAERTLSELKFPMPK